MWRSQDQVPTNTAESDAMSKELQQRGFKFVGTNDLLCLHAGSRYGQRPHNKLF